MSKHDDTPTDDDVEPTVTTSDNDNRRPPGGGAAGCPVEEEEDEPVMPSDVQPDYVAQAREAAGRLTDRDWELDPDKPWTTKDSDARLERAKEQARQNKVTSNYGKAGWA